jgi:glycolate oxidase FAD binding subunit
MSSAPVTMTPADTHELTHLVQSAIAACTPIQILGGDSKAAVGYPSRQTLRVSMSRFDRIVDYDPAELVLTVDAGVKLSAIQALLAEHDQMLAFEPEDIAKTLGSCVGTSTIGGIVAAGFAGSRRVSAGNVRDHVLGFAAVSGRGEAFVAGGRVVKNVTGYDLSKLMCGSWGQLAAMTTLTLKVLPRPKMSLTLAAPDLGIEASYIYMTRALRSQADVAAAAYVPARPPGHESLMLLRLEGFGPSVQARATHLESLIETPLERLDAAPADALWSRIRSADIAHADAGDDVLWRLCVPATAGAAVCTTLRESDAHITVDWGGALIWARMTVNAEPAGIRALAERAGGHATLLCAPEHYRLRAPALHPEAPGVAALSRRVKASFDPAGILDPHRFEAPPA